MAQTKTNAMRILDAKNISYEMQEYDSKDGKIDGVSVAAKIGRSPGEVFKTLVTQGASKAVFVFVIPVDVELDLKKAAKVSGEKKLEMVPVKDIQKWTGYIRGGCSPVGMKKEYQTFIDQSCQTIEKMVVSAGKIGLQLVIEPNQLKEATKAQYAELTK